MADDKTTGDKVGGAVDTAIGAVTSGAGAVKDGYNKNVAPAVDNAVEGVKKIYNENVAPTVDNAVDGAKKMIDKATGSAKTFGEETDDKSGGFLGKNKALLMGGVIALFAMFGMEGGIMPLLFAAVALLGGALVDGDKGIFAGPLGLKKDGTPGLTIDKSKDSVVPKPPEQEQNKEQNNKKTDKNSSISQEKDTDVGLNEVKFQEVLNASRQKDILERDKNGVDISRDKVLVPNNYASVEQPKAGRNV